MEYKIIHEDAFPLVECKLQQGETLKAESDAMVSMTEIWIFAALWIEIFWADLHGVFSREKAFFKQLQRLVAPGTVLLGHAAPGGIVDVELDGSYSLRVQKMVSLAGTSGIEVDTTIQNLTPRAFSREGFLSLMFGGGTVFLSSFGAIHAINLNPGEGSHYR